MSILAARSHLCNNDEVLRRVATSDASLDEACATLHRPYTKPPSTCPYRDTPYLGNTMNGLREAVIFDIEDAIHIGDMKRGCPYYATRELQQTSDIIFAPYNYLINPTIREAMGVNTDNAVLIFDEAHNIEDTCREAASISLTLHALQNITIQLTEPPHAFFEDTYFSLWEVFNALLQWFCDTEHMLQVDDVSDFDNTWSGQDAIDLLNSIGLSGHTLASYKDKLDYISTDDSELKAKHGSKLVIAYDNEHRRRGITPGSALIMQNFFVTLSFLFDSNNHLAYRMVMQRTMPKGKGKRQQRSETSLHFLCMSAAVAFKPVTQGCHCVLLTSGTLSPLDSFAGELGVPFPVRVEAGHVIDMDKQVKVAAVKAIGDIPLNCVYQNQLNTAFQEALGEAALSIARATPGGVLLFFPSYSFLDRVVNRWKECGIDDELSQITDYFVEPRDAKSLESIINKYYNAVNSSKRGMLMAVCRGKVSEGIDFADNYARTVVVIGIPFPNYQDVGVRLKKSYQNEARANDNNLVSGDVWYSQQAFRAVNQAVGRCIRHKRDYGAIILLDTRFSHDTNQKQLSRWLRNAVGTYIHLSDIMVPLRSFFDENLAALGDNVDNTKPGKTPRKKRHMCIEDTPMMCDRPSCITPVDIAPTPLSIGASSPIRSLLALDDERLTIDLTMSQEETQGNEFNDLYDALLNITWCGEYNTWPGVCNLRIEPIPQQLSFICRQLSSCAICIVSEDMLRILRDTDCPAVHKYEQWHAGDGVVYREVSLQNDGDFNVIMVQVLACSAQTAQFTNHTYLTHDFCQLLQDYFSQLKCDRNNEPMNIPQCAGVELLS